MAVIKVELVGTDSEDVEAKEGYETVITQEGKRKRQQSGSSRNIKPRCPNANQCCKNTEDKIQF